MHILHRPSGYHFRFRFQIPTDVQHHFNKKELRYSLKTGQRGLARSRSRLLAGHLQQFIRKLRTGHMDLTPEKTNELIQRYIKRSLGADEQARINDTDPFDLNFHTIHAEILDKAREITRRRLVPKDQAWIGPTVDDLLKTEGITPDKDSPDYRMLCRETLKAEDYIMSVQERRHQRDYSQDPSFQPEQPVVTAVETPEQESIST